MQLLHPSRPMAVPFPGAAARAPLPRLPFQWRGGSKRRPSGAPRRCLLGRNLLSSCLQLSQHSSLRRLSRYRSSCSDFNLELALPESLVDKNADSRRAHRFIAAPPSRRTQAHHPATPCRLCAHAASHLNTFDRVRWQSPVRLPCYQPSGACAGQSLRRVGHAAHLQPALRILDAAPTSSRLSSPGS